MAQTVELTIGSLIKKIESGKVPTIDVLEECQIAYGIVDGKMRIYVREGNNIVEFIDNGIDLTSKTEQLTGNTWNGKPEYMIAFTGSPSLPNNATISSFNPGGGTLWRFDEVNSGYIEGNTFRKFTISNTQVAGKVWIEIVEGTGVSIHNNSGSAWTPNPFYIVFKYIKAN